MVLWMLHVFVTWAATKDCVDALWSDEVSAKSNQMLNFLSLVRRALQAFNLAALERNPNTSQLRPPANCNFERLVLTRPFQSEYVPLFTVGSQVAMSYL